MSKGKVCLSFSSQKNTQNALPSSFSTPKKSKKGGEWETSQGPPKRSKGGELYWELPTQVRQGPLGGLLGSAGAEGLAGRVSGKTSFLPLDPLPLPRPSRPVLLPARLPKGPKLLPAPLGSWEDYQALRRLWEGYVTQLLGPLGGQMSQALLKADFHGAPLRVVRAKCPTLVGITGILLQETQGVFRLVTQGSQEPHEVKAVTVPKTGTVVQLNLPSPLPAAVLYASHLRVRPATRSSKRFKAQPSLCL